MAYVKQQLSSEDDNENTKKSSLEVEEGIAVVMEDAPNNEDRKMKTGVVIDYSKNQFKFMASSQDLSLFKVQAVELPSGSYSTIA